MKVFILATYNPGNDLRYSKLVFETLRIGFPTAEVEVFINGSDEGFMESVLAVADPIGCKVQVVPRTIHHEWIKSLIERETEPFWLLDTDVIFYDCVENWTFTKPLAGYRVPEFEDEFTKATTQARLHTSLLRIDPLGVRDAVHFYKETKINLTPFNPLPSLVYPQCLPKNGGAIVYDTLSLLYHAIGGDEFSDEQKDAYFHFHFGTFGALVLPYMKDGDEMRGAREEILDRPILGHGLWRAQDDYYARRQCAQDGENVIAPIKQEDAQEAIRWNVKLCCGDRDAMAFCDQWYDYCHGIDDLIDTMRDGRPRMSKAQMIGLFFRAAVLYNCSFFVRNRELLTPIVLLVTNTYQDSVAWEKSHKSHLRQMGDVFRTCGNEMFVMVALVCGGEAHMRQMSMAIKERDWLGQHTASGRPL